MNNKVKIQLSGYEAYVKDGVNGYLNDASHTDDERRELIQSLSERERKIFEAAFRLGFWYGSEFVAESIFGVDIDDMVEDMDDEKIDKLCVESLAL